MSSNSIRIKTSLPGISSVSGSRPGNTWSSSNPTIRAVVYKNRSASYDSDMVQPTTYGILSGTASADRRVFEKYFLYMDEGAPKFLRATTTGGTLSGAVQGPLTTDSLLKICNPTEDYTKAFITWPIDSGDRVENEILKKLDDQSIDLGGLVAELTETVTYVSTRGKQLANFGASLMKGNLRTALKSVGVKKKTWKRYKDSSFTSKTDSHLTQLSSAWLELNFAIRPTIRDISDATSLYSDPNKVLGKVKLRASASVPLKLRDEKRVVSGSTITDYSAEIGGTVRMKIVYGVTDPAIVAQKALGLNNLPASAWEAVPFSWLLDYVVNTGEFLSLMTATEGLTFKYGYKSLKFIERRLASSTTLVNSAHGGYYRAYHNGNATYEGYARIPITSFPRPTFRPVLFDGHTSKQITNTLALGKVLTSKNRRLHGLVN